MNTAQDGISGISIPSNMKRSTCDENQGSEADIEDNKTMQSFIALHEN